VGGLEAGDALETLRALRVTHAHAVEAGIGIAVIAGDHDEDVVAAGGQREHLGERVVERELVRQQRADVVEVRRVVDARALDLQQEGISILQETGQRGIGHFRQRGHARGEFGVVVAVDGKRQVAAGEGA
jgi:hypothetical protein